MKSRMKARMPVKKEYIPFHGGLDLTTPNIEAKSGTIRNSQNVYQGENGGYITMGGYESFDGTTLPTAQQYATLPVFLTGAVVPGDTITDGIATGLVLKVEQGYLVLISSTGTFSTGNIALSIPDESYENRITDNTDWVTDGVDYITDGVSTVGSCIGPQIIGGGPTSERRAFYKFLAENYARALITSVPGSGDILGVWYYGGKWYSFRKDTTTVKMYVESESGWVVVPLGLEVTFESGGTYQPLEGNTITGASSGATAVLTRVVLESGTWAAGTAAGRFIFAVKTGDFSAENLNIGANSNVATITGNASAITFTVIGGRFEFGNYNFTGNSRSKRMYGVDGKNRGFEFDGTVFIPIKTGMTTDAPSHLWESNGSMYYSFSGSVQKSVAGYPYQWSVVLGAGEVGMSDDVTGFMEQTGDGSGAVLSVFSKNRTSNLYSSGLVPFKNEVGAKPFTIQRIGSTFFLSDFGIMSLDATQNYGNFQDSIVSSKISPWLETRINQATASCIVRTKNQYWVFFSDKSAICCTIAAGKIVALCPQYLSHRVTCIASVEDDSGEEVIMFGSTDGKIRRLFSGKSFDGSDIDWFAELSYDHLKSPTTDKKMRLGVFEVKGDSYAEFLSSYSLGYGDPDIAQHNATLKVMNLASVYWDSFVWDTFTWDGKVLYPSILDMTGTGENVSLIIKGRSSYSGQLKFSGALVVFTPTKNKVYSTQ